MFSFNDKISLRQFQILLILYIFGTGVIILPRKAAIYAGRDGWIAFILTITLAVFAVFVITSLVKRFPHKSFYEYASTLITRPIAVILTLGLIAKTIVGLACELRFFAEIVKYVLLYNTPYAVIAISLLLLSAYAAGKGIETKARIGQIIIWLIFIPLIFVFIVVSTDVDFSELQPVLQTEPRQLAAGAYHLFFAFSGIEFILLISPYVNSHKHMPSRAVSSIFAIGVFMCLCIILAIGRFGPNSLTYQMWPILEMMDATPLPGSFIERQEAIMMSFWILSVFAMISGGLFFSSVAAKSVFKVGRHKYYLLIIGASAFVLSLALNDMTLVYRVMDMNFLYLGTAYMLAIPVLLLVIAMLRGINYGKQGPAKILPVILAALLLSGCWDSSELANRGFVTSMSIDLDDESENAYKVSLEMPLASSAGSDKLEKNVKSNFHRSLNSAIYGAGVSSDKEIFLGHMKVLIYGEDILSDSEMFKHTLDTLVRDRSVSRTLLILAAKETGADVIEAELEDENLMGIYISDFFRKKNPSTVYRQTLDKLSRYFSQGQVALIPRIEKSDEGVKLSGAAVMSNYTLKGWLDEEELRGLMWVHEGHHELNIPDTNDHFSINIIKYKSDMSFFERNNRLYAKISIKLDGDIEEAPLNSSIDHNSIIQTAEKNIEDDVKKAYEALYSRMGVDGFSMERALERKNPSLHRTYIEDGTISIMEIPVILDINVTIRSTGAVGGEV